MQVLQKGTIGGSPAEDQTKYDVKHTDADMPV